MNHRVIAAIADCRLRLLIPLWFCYLCHPRKSAARLFSIRKHESGLTFDRAATANRQ